MDAIGHVREMKMTEQLGEIVAELGSARSRAGAGDPPSSSLGAKRYLADAVHALGKLYGQGAGPIERAASRPAPPAMAQWLVQASMAFQSERNGLTRLVVAAGPLPSTPGHAGDETALLAARHAIDMLGHSERDGCALGAALALMLDWPSLRVLLDEAAEAFGLEPASCSLPVPDAIIDRLDTVPVAPPQQRALLFGARQLLLQHHALWTLLAGRSRRRSEG